LTPEEILKQVASISAGDDSPDSSDTTRIMRYVNNGYRAVYRQTSEMNRNKLLTSEDVTITTGSGTMTIVPLSIEQVRDTTTDDFLEASDIEYIEKKLDEDIDDTGAPEIYYWNDTTTINTWPEDSTTIRVRYIPTPATLTSAGTEASILIPVAYHDILVEAALFYMYQDENDIRSISEIQTRYRDF